jgi:hypothetical protein
MDEKEKRLLHNKGLTPEDYYLDAHGQLIFTAFYLLKRGYCCRTGCRHCPYGFRTDHEKTDKERRLLPPGAPLPDPHNIP